MHPVSHMGYNAELRKGSRTPQTSRAVKEKKAFTRADQSSRLHDQLKSEEPISNIADLHHGVKQNQGDTQFFPGKPLGNCQKPFTERKAKDDELVKHMSNLPCYLQREEKVENFQEKVFNFGVLDWTRLENWKYNQKSVTCKSTMYSPSTSNTSSPFSTVGSSTLSTRSDSGIQTHRKKSTSRGADLAYSSNDSHSVIVKPTNDVRASLKDKAAIFKSPSGGQQNIPGTRLNNQRNQMKAKFEKSTKDEMNSKFIKEVGSSSSSSKGGEVPFSPKGKTKVPEGEYRQRTERIQEPISARQHCPGRDKTIVLLLPDRKFSSPSRMSIDGKESEKSRSSFSDGLYIHGGDQYSKVHSEIPHSCPQFSKPEPSKQLNLILPRSLDAVCSKDPVGISHSPRRSTETHSIQTECVQAEENKLITKPDDLMATSHLKEEARLSARSRNDSPNHWLSVGKGKISRSHSFKGGSDLPQLSSTYVTTKSGPVGSDLPQLSSTYVTTKSGPNTSSREKMTTNTRLRSSPLRRLLDPLLRSRTANCLPSAVPLAHNVRKSSDGPVPVSVETPKRIITTSADTTPADTNSVYQDEKHEVSMVQALLQVSVKNGLPWFTFAVDNSSDILAATMRKTGSTEKYDCSWIYTFYLFRKSKKKSGGWMGQGSKTANSDYVHNVVGQMKVNGSQTKHDSKSQLMTREFVLFDVEPRKADQEASLNAELAGLVIKVPTESKGILSSDKKQSNNPTVGRSQGLPSIVVVLPTGIHGLSAGGLPSPLLDRWRSGGSCDCGGWDLGCQLRLLSSQENDKDIDSVDLCGAQDNFDLCVQGGGSRERIASLSFATFNKGVHSVDFNSLISPLQAFSISIAFLHCKNLAKVSSLFQETSPPEPSSVKSEITVLSTQPLERKSSSSAPFPPPSPVGRV